MSQAHTALISWSVQGMLINPAVNGPIARWKSYRVHADVVRQQALSHSLTASDTSQVSGGAAPPW